MGTLFTHWFPLPANMKCSDMIKIACFTFTIFPFRVIVITFLLALAWFAGEVGSIGLSASDLYRRPITGWRKKVRGIVCWCGLMIAHVGGVRVTTVGSQTSRQVAPILIAAPHTSFLDGIVAFLTGLPCVLVLEKLKYCYFVTRVLNFMQPIYVGPVSDPSSAAEIMYRIKPNSMWPQVLIFAEGRCTDGKQLLRFKSGAFRTGRPVQPIGIRYSNTLDTLTWITGGPRFIVLLWLTLCQWRTNCTVHYLEVYIPNENEIRHPQEYANNVRLYMSRELNIPISSHNG